MKLYNSLTREIEEFKPLRLVRPAHGKPLGKVGVYTCGPTVYDYVTIGNFRTYFLSDMVVRALMFFDFEVKYIMNITDVGHLTGDNLGDADTGEDRMEKGASREGKTAFKVAEFYIKDFLIGFEKLNMIKPYKFTKATEYIKEQIELLKKIEEKGLAYRIDDGIYFDVAGYEKEGNKYGEISTLDEIKAGARVERNNQKKDQRDFALWKFSPSTSSTSSWQASLGQAKREMEWDSPWGVGFPGWHLECSAMSMKHLGEQFDIHIGGEDLRSTHHPNEIAQTESVTQKKPMAKYWLHGAFLKVDGGRMGKSLGNAYTVADLEKKGYQAMALRYFYLTGHYRKSLNFTFKALNGASEAYNRLKSMVRDWQGEKSRTKLSEEKLDKVQGLSLKFREALENDLNMPQAMAVVWEMAKSNIPEQDKWELITDWDQVLGLNLDQTETKAEKIPTKVIRLADERQEKRHEGDFKQADLLRVKIKALGFKIEDKGKSYILNRL
jgi:cysteinyl-tRNA synthetase